VGLSSRWIITKGGIILTTISIVMLLASMAYTAIWLIIET